MGTYRCWQRVEKRTLYNTHTQKLKTCCWWWWSPSESCSYSLFHYGVSLVGFFLLVMLCMYIVIYVSLVITLFTFSRMFGWYCFARSLAHTYSNLVSQFSLAERKMKLNNSEKGTLRQKICPEKLFFLERERERQLLFLFSYYISDNTSARIQPTYWFCSSHSLVLFCGPFLLSHFLSLSHILVTYTISTTIMQCNNISFFCWKVSSTTITA